MICFPSNHKHAVTTILITVICILFLFSCTDYRRVEEDEFLGTWQLKGRKMFEGLQVRIIKDNEDLKGYITAVPANKYARLFLDSGSVWVVDIERTSNFVFKIKEQKIANELFAIYGLETTSPFYATFSEEKDRINLFRDTQGSVQNSDVYYERLSRN
jgi:hypothetical protein